MVTDPQPTPYVQPADPITVGKLIAAQTQARIDAMRAERARQEDAPRG